MRERRLVSFGLLMLLASAVGCASGGRLGLLPAEGHRLEKVAKQIREGSCPGPTTPRELDKQLAPSYVVEPGDVLLVQPAAFDSPVRLPGDQTVLPDGTIQLGRYGKIMAAGRTVEEIEAEVNRIVSAAEQQSPSNNQPTKPEQLRVLARLVTRDSKVFYVLGEVNAPGSFPLKGRECVLDAILAAGGLNSNASRKLITLVRPSSPESCRVVLPVDYNGIVTLGDTNTNYHVKAGDRIYVPTRGFTEDLCNLVGHGPRNCRGPQAGCGACETCGGTAAALPVPAAGPTYPSGYPSTYGTSFGPHPGTPPTPAPARMPPAANAPPYPGANSWVPPPPNPRPVIAAPVPAPVGPAVTVHPPLPLATLPAVAPIPLPENRAGTATPGGDQEPPLSLPGNERNLPPGRIYR